MSTEGRSQPAFWHFSFSIANGVLYPGGKRGGGRGGPSSTAGSSFGLAFVEFPALPDRTTFVGFFLGGMYAQRSRFSCDTAASFSVRQAADPVDANWMDERVDWTDQQMFKLVFVRLKPPLCFTDHSFRSQHTVIVWSGKYRLSYSDRVQSTQRPRQVAI